MKSHTLKLYALLVASVAALLIGCVGCAQDAHTTVKADAGLVGTDWQWVGPPGDAGTVPISNGQGVQSGWGTLTAAGVTPGAAGQFYLTNDAGSGAIWALPTGDLSCSASTPGSCNVATITGSAGTATITANSTLSGAAGSGALSLGSMTGATTLPTGNVSWTGASTKTLNLQAAGNATIDSAAGVLLCGSNCTTVNLGNQANTSSWTAAISSGSHYAFTIAGANGLTVNATEWQPGADNTVALADATKRMASVNALLHNVYHASADTQPSAQLADGQLLFGVGGSTAADLQLIRNGAHDLYVTNASNGAAQMEIGGSSATQLQLLSTGAVKIPQVAGTAAGTNMSVLAQPAGTTAATNTLGGSLVIGAGADNGITADAAHFHAPVIVDVNGSELVRFTQDGVGQKYVDFTSTGGTAILTATTFDIRSAGAFYFDAVGGNTIFRTGGGFTTALTVVSNTELQPSASATMALGDAALPWSSTYIASGNPTTGYYSFLHAQGTISTSAQIGQMQDNFFYQHTTDHNTHLYQVWTTVASHGVHVHSWITGRASTSGTYFLAPVTVTNECEATCYDSAGTVTCTTPFISLEEDTCPTASTPTACFVCTMTTGSHTVTVTWAKYSEVLDAVVETQVRSIFEANDLSPLALLLGLGPLLATSKRRRRWAQAVSDVGERFRRAA